MKTWTALVVAALLTACAATGPRDKPAALADPAQFGAGAVGSDFPAADWWRAWGDPQLDALVDQALAGQPGLRVAAARLRQAQAAAGVAGSAQAPQVNLGADLSDQRFTENGMVPPPLAGSIHWNNSVQVGLAWDLDLFGRQRSALEAAIGQQRAAAAELQSARLALAAQVVAGYVELARLGQAQTLAQQSLQQRDQVLALVRQRIAAGLDTQVELRQAEGLIAQSRVELEALDQAMVQARHALAELAGQGPQQFATLAPRLTPLPSLVLPAALPADLVGRRADLVAQRWRVQAAWSDIDAARAQFYPNVNLVAFAGLSSLGLDRLTESGSLTYGAGPALRLPIFDGGRLRAQLGARDAEADAAVESWNAALLRALREVADETSRLQSLERQQRLQADATTAATAAFDLALQRYQAGLGNFLVVLAAQTNVLVQRRAATDLLARHLTSEVVLARALGGGWTPTEMPPVPAAAPQTVR
jgi:NodT family efflux transporter outer membrane factor (OMF) lipoprotein